MGRMSLLKGSWTDYIKYSLSCEDDKHEVNLKSLTVSVRATLNEEQTSQHIKKNKNLNSMNMFSMNKI